MYLCWYFKRVNAHLVSRSTLDNDETVHARDSLLRPAAIFQISLGLSFAFEFIDGR